jgi:hypothetical protein
VAPWHETRIGVGFIVHGQEQPFHLFQRYQPPVFDLLIVNLCARRLCFFLASRASAYLFVACGEADFFSAFALVSGTALDSELTTGVVLIFSSPQNFSFLVGMATVWLRRWFLHYPKQPRTENNQAAGQWWADSAIASRFSSGPAATHEPQLTHWDSMSALFTEMVICMN